MNKKPCIFVHRGSQDYLDNVLFITRFYSPTAQLILLGDETNKLIAEKHNVDHHMITDYEEVVPYHHYSVNKEEYEKFCFQRWFIIKNFCIKNNIREIIHSDSDNAFFTDINTLDYIDAAFIVNSVVIVPNVLFIATDNLIKICEFYISLYSRSKDEILSHIRYIKKNEEAHYSDMHFLFQAITELKLKFENLPTQKESKIFNYHINNCKTTFCDGLFFVKDTNCQVLNLHFQGKTKSMTQDYKTIISHQ